jgi:hypothetical protein
MYAFNKSKLHLTWALYGIPNGVIPSIRVNQPALPAQEVMDEGKQDDESSMSTTPFCLILQASVVILTRHEQGNRLKPVALASTIQLLFACSRW